MSALRAATLGFFSDNSLPGGHGLPFGFPFVLPPSSPSSYSSSSWAATTTSTTALRKVNVTNFPGDLVQEGFGMEAAFRKSIGFTGHYR